MSYEYLREERIEFDGGRPARLLTIDRPKMNALNGALLGELDAYLTGLAAAEVSSLIITGAGRAFVAGADIKEMAAMDRPAALEFSRHGQAVFRRLEALDCVTIAALNGYALGGGCELALACDLRLAAEQAVLGQPEVQLGLIPGFGGTQRLPRIVGPAKAKELILIGGQVKADEARRIGLVNRVVEAENLLPTARRWAEQIAARGPVSVAAAKRVIQDGVWGGLKEEYELEARAFGDLFAGSEAREGMTAFVEKRPPRFGD
jgi:enoyl-CoA hydratase